MLAHTFRLLVRPTITIGSAGIGLPWPYELVELAARLVPKSPFTRRETVQLGSCTAQLIHAAGVPQDDSTGVILYMHGGGFLACGPNTHSHLITRLSKYSNCPVLAVDYRKLPEWSPLDAIDDCTDAYGWLRRFYEPDQIALAGDSAGGYLAMSTALWVNWFQDEVPAALALLSPLLELDPTAKSTHPNVATDAMLSPEALEALHSLALEASVVPVLFDPLECKNSELPPTTIHVSGSELLLHDAELAADAIADAGSDVELVVWPDQMHVFQIAAPLVPEADVSLREIAGFISREFQKGAVNGLTNPTDAVGL